MRVAVASTGSPDYLTDIVADGLLRVLGKENVHLAYNRKTPSDGMKSQLMEGFDYPDPFGLFDAEALVVSNRTPASIMMEWMKRTGRKSVAVLDGEDDDVLRNSYRDCRVYFKREYIIGRRYPSTVAPLPFAAIPEPYGEGVSRDIPVFFSCMIRNEVRLQIAATLDRMGIRLERGSHENTGTIGGLTGKSSYNERLRRSAIGISARGAGWDTYRYWETPYFGAALLSQRMGIVIPDDFQAGVEAEFFSSMDEFEKMLKALLADPDRVARLGEAGRQAVLNRHLSIHRAKRVLEAITR